MESCRHTGQNTTAEAIPIIETILASGSEQERQNMNNKQAVP